MEIDKQYNIIESIYETSRNVIYKVIDKKDGKTKALKLLKTSDSTTDLESLFRKEFLILQTLNHPNIVNVYKLSTAQINGKKKQYFTMEFVDGIPINQYFKKNGFSSFANIFLDVLRLLSYIHTKGFLHCDLKPHHILVTTKGEVKLVDFGFAMFKRFDINNVIGGTLQYSAPEILKG
ncbi:MAG: hypothetical protein B5M53_01720, partial [Candidatus Cloacimonas sp. 4484_209]